MKKLRAIKSIIEILARTNGHINIPSLARELSNQDHGEVSIHSVKKYINEIQDDFDIELDKKQGRDGGYALSEKAWKQISQINNLRLSVEQKNALNDAFEIAEKSSTFYYYDDLLSAKGKLYLNFNFKDKDFEYYVGKSHTNRKHTELVKKIKRSMINKNRVNIISKYEYFNIPKRLELVKPLYLIHDNDETFLIVKDHKDKYLYQNILNIKEYEITKEKFIIYRTENIKNHINDLSLKIKGEYKLSFTITSERGKSIFNLWNYQFKDISKYKDKKTIIFFEEYKVYQFLFRIQPHINNFRSFNKKIINGWNNNISLLKVI